MMCCSVPGFSTDRLARTATKNMIRTRKTRICMATWSGIGAVG